MYQIDADQTSSRVRINCCGSNVVRKLKYLSHAPGSHIRATSLTMAETTKKPTASQIVRHRSRSKLEKSVVTPARQ